MENRLERFIGWTGRVLVAGMGAGLVIGVGFRVAMRVAAIVDPRAVEFTVGGTVFVVLLGMTVGTVVGPIYGAIRRFIPRPKGLWFGLMLAGLFALALFGDPAGEARTVGVAWVNAITFPGSGLLAGLAIEPLTRWVAGRRRLTGRVGAGAVAGGAVAGAIGGVVAPVAGVLTGQISVAEAPVVAIGFAVQAAMFGVVLGTLLALIARFPRRRPLVVATVAGMLGGGGWWAAAVAAGPSGPLSMGPDALVLIGGAVVFTAAAVAMVWMANRLSAGGGARTQGTEVVAAPVGVG